MAKWKRPRKARKTEEALSSTERKRTSHPLGPVDLARGDHAAGSFIPETTYVSQPISPAIGKSAMTVSLCLIRRQLSFNAFLALEGVVFVLGPAMSGIFVEGDCLIPFPKLIQT